ncbi:hypothetical protein [Amycolatopsis jejuensis]|uniref:hypothetical protein n=1 Tax=Amycolatopsis jejuensis TaxID=330084 RepID=UPI0005267967|nr:hypothetical protein [Amycolatopsis jejuensis]
MQSPARRIVALGFAAVAASGCAAPENLRFTRDHRVQLTAPADQEEVTVPFTVRWTARDVPIAPPERPTAPGTLRFAVFVDRDPIAPGGPLRSLGENDPGCRARPACPDDAYLSRLGVFVTSESSQLLAWVGKAVDGKNTHKVTVVLVDASGRRVGESYWSVSFRVPGGAR